MTELAQPLPIGASTPLDEIVDVVREWVEATVPAAWRSVAAAGGNPNTARTADEYERWYPAFAASGLVVPTWAREYCGLGLGSVAAQAIERVLAPYRLRRLNPLGLNNAAAAILAHGTEAQRRRFLPPIVFNRERWCQLFSEPGAGSDLASLACRAERDGDEWRVTGQKVWTTWATDSEFAILLARTDPDRPKHAGLTYFVLELDQPGVEIRPLRQITGEAEFNEVWLDGARIPDSQRVGALGDGWNVSRATLASERSLVAGSSSSRRLKMRTAVELAKANGTWDDPSVRDQAMQLWSHELVSEWTNLRVRSSRAAGQSPGAAASIAKVRWATLNQQIHEFFVDVLGASGMAWEPERPADAVAVAPERYLESLRAEVRSMLRTRANSIEGGTTEVNRNILGERVLGLPREPDPYRDAPWKEVPRS